MLPMDFRQLRRQQHIQGLPDDLLIGVSEDLFSALVKEDNALFLVHRDDGVIGEIQNLS
jgi:hypothetical protein